MTQTKVLSRLSSAIAVAGLIAAFILPTMRVGALTDSSLLLSDPRPSQTSDYTFDTSSLTTGTTINCIQLDIGTLSDGTGDVGLDLTGIALGTNTIPSSGTWADASVDGTDDQLRATSAGGATPNASGSISWTGIVNGATDGTTYFGVFETFSNVDCATGGPVDSVTVTFIYKEGEPVQLTIDPTLTFTCTGVNTTAQTVNGASVNTDSTGSSIDFGNFVSGSTGVSAHDLGVSTNAPGGYTVSIRQSGDFANIANAADVIDPWTGTNAAPTTSFPTTTEAWGYTTEDSTLNTPNPARFTDTGNEWAGFQTTNEPVVFNDSAAPSVETTRVGHQVSVANTTPAGTYQTTIIYTVASVY